MIRKLVAKLNFLTLLAAFISFWGVGDIYHGKQAKEDKQTLRGIFFFGIGAAGIGFMNPVFNSALLSGIVALLFSGISLSMMAYIFLHTHPEEMTIVANAEILDAEKEDRKVLEKKHDIPSYGIEKMSPTQEKVRLQSSSGGAGNEYPTCSFR